MTKTSSLKTWARDHMIGVENTTFPSFTRDLSALDEAGIRHDVRMAKKHGFFWVQFPTCSIEAQRFRSVARA
jgi:hypothetical protein